MGENNYFENLIFQGGKCINVSRKIDARFSDMLHWHQYTEILISLRDHNEVTVNDTPYQMDMNDFIFVYSGSLHSVHYVTEDSFLVIQFPMEILTKMNELREPVSLLSRKPYLKYDPYSKDFCQMMTMLREIVEIYESSDPFRETQIYSLLLQLFILIGRIQSITFLPGFFESERSGDKNSSLIAQACIFITENCFRPLTLDNVSHQIGISKSHFSHLFKYYTNMTFVDYLTAERIRRAESFFPDPKMRIVDIAFEAGFSSISSFNRAFKKIKGCSPSAFRKTRVD